LESGVDTILICNETLSIDMLTICSAASREIVEVSESSFFNEVVALGLEFTPL